MSFYDRSSSFFFFSCAYLLFCVRMQDEGFLSIHHRLWKSTVLWWTLVCSFIQLYLNVKTKCINRQKDFSTPHACSWLLLFVSADIYIFFLLSTFTVINIASSNTKPVTVSCTIFVPSPGAVMRPTQLSWIFISKFTKSNLLDSMANCYMCNYIWSSVASLGQV